jgi:SET domain-containing protein 6
LQAHVNHGDSLEVNSLRSKLPAGTEILNYYGPLPSSELLRRYGYVTPEHRRYDVVELPWSLVRSALAQQLSIAEDVLEKLVSSRSQGVDTMLTSLQQTRLEKEEELEDYFVIERDSGEPDGQGRLTYDVKLRELSPELDEQLTIFLKALKKSNPEVIADKRKRIESVKAAIVQALTAKLAQYPTSVQEDETLLNKSDLAKRNRMAIEVRLGEKLLLQEAIALMQGDTVPGEEANGERSTKRARTHA